MNWSDAGRIALVILAMHLIEFGLSEAWEWTAVGAALLVLAGASWLSRRAWLRRMERLRKSSPEARDAELAAFDPGERSAARLALAIVGSADAHVDPREGESFAYPRTPRTLRAVLGAALLFMSALPTALLLANRVGEDQRTWAALVGIGFAVGLVLAFKSWREEERMIRITPAGIQEVLPTGQSTGMLWSEVARVRNRPWLGSLEVKAGDRRRRIRIGYRLTGFTRCLELMVAYLHWANEQFGGLPTPSSEESAGIGA